MGILRRRGKFEVAVDRLIDHGQLMKQVLAQRFFVSLKVIEHLSSRQHALSRDRPIEPAGSRRTDDTGNDIKVVVGQFWYVAYYVRHSLPCSSVGIFVESCVYAVLLSLGTIEPSAFVGDERRDTPVHTHLLSP